MIQSKSCHPSSPKGAAWRQKQACEKETSAERGKTEVSSGSSAAGGNSREHHVEGESWLKQHVGIQSFVGEAIAGYVLISSCIESHVVLFPNSFLREWF